jgi:uncharacterized integral membrane protein
LFGYPIVVIIGGALIFGGLTMAIVTTIRIARAQRREKRNRYASR